LQPLRTYPTPNAATDDRDLLQEPDLLAAILVNEIDSDIERRLRLSQLSNAPILCIENVVATNPELKRITKIITSELHR